MYPYFKEIEDRTNDEYKIAEEARQKGFDPRERVEITIATNLAQRSTALVAAMYPQVKSEAIERRIKELEQEYGFLDHAVCLKIAEEIAKERFCKFRSLLEAIDAGIRVAFAYYTLGVVVPPLEGFTHFEVRKTQKGEEYWAAFYSGPIRAAGTTAAAFSAVIIDYLRHMFGYAKYDPTEEEIKRQITEIYDYHERITNLQYLASEKEIDFFVRNLPIQLEGLPSEEREVSNYKDLPRVSTNRLRNGICLMISESLTQKAPKLLKIVQKLKAKGFKLPDWDFLEEFVKLQKEYNEEKKQKARSTYMQDAVAGRPVFSYPSRSGGFRLRYGRTRATGYSAVAISPATASITDNFIAIATQLKLEKPMKAAAMAICEEIDGPIIKLLDGSVVKVKNKEEADKLKKEIKEIIYLGDILISYGDFYNRNQLLLPCGYNNEWWLAELREVAIKYSDPEKLLAKTEAQLEGIQHALENLDKTLPSMDDAIRISMLFDIPLHPEYIFFWSQITPQQFTAFIEWLANSEINDKNLVLPNDIKFADGKRAAELLGLEHKVQGEQIFIDLDIARALALNIGADLDNIKEKSKEILERMEEAENKTDTLELINSISKFKIKDKAGTFIGARMGRPEKAKERELTGSPHVIFPVGEEGGRLRSVQEAMKVGYVEADWPFYWCENCRHETVYALCHKCGAKTNKLHYCPSCRKKISSENCPLHGPAQKHAEQRVSINEYFNSALKLMKVGEIPLIKGIRGTSSKEHIPEYIGKGILRAHFNVHVNKDGTVRYDCSELPLTQFTPEEISVPIERLKELGYNKDLFGKELKHEDQVLELKPHDVILPCVQDIADEPASKTFFRVAKFVDAELEKIYGMKPFYNLKSEKDLIGHLLLCMAPHNCAGVVGRIIGFSNTQAFLASPYMHAAMRRDCDGDESAMMLLLDALINFSREYLPAHRGATQDAPLILNARIRPAEVDDMIFDMDVVKSYPLELYMAAEKNLPANSVKIDQISDRIKINDLAPFKNLYYTHSIKSLNNGIACSNYKLLATMFEKLDHQMALAEKIRAVDATDMARLIIDRHFLRDIKGNFHKFTTQQFRCVGCNEKYRRPPIEGKCIKCGGRIIFTIAEGSIIKYLEAAQQLAKKYNVQDYTVQNLKLLKDAIESLFGKETEKQQQLQQWA
jgi:DNA polymerase II large subunit